MKSHRWQRPICCKRFFLTLHGNQFSDFFGKTCLNRPAESLRCLPVTAVRPVLYLNLQSNYTKFLHFVRFCFFRWRTAVSFFSSIDRFQLVCFARVAACPPFLEDALSLCRLRRHFPTLWGITLAELSQLDRSRLRRATLYVTPSLAVSSCHYSKIRLKSLV